MLCRLVEAGYDVHRSTGINQTVLGAVGVPRQPIDPRSLELLPGVREVVKISAPYKLVGRTFKSEDTLGELGGVVVGGPEVVVISGIATLSASSGFHRSAQLLISTSQYAAPRPEQAPGCAATAPPPSRPSSRPVRPRTSSV